MESEPNPYRSPIATDTGGRQPRSGPRRSVVGWVLFFGGMAVLIGSDSLFVAWRGSRVGDIVVAVLDVAGIGMLAVSVWMAISGQLRRMSQGQEKREERRGREQ